MTLIFLGGGGGEEVRWKTVRTYGKILATPLNTLDRAININKTFICDNTSLALMDNFLIKN